AGTGKVPARRSGWLPGQADADRAAPERQLVARDVEVLEAVVVEGAEVADVGADGEAAAPHERADAAVPPETALPRLEIEKVVLDVRPDQAEAERQVGSKRAAAPAEEEVRHRGDDLAVGARLLDAVELRRVSEVELEPAVAADEAEGRTV